MYPKKKKNQDPVILINHAELNFFDWLVFRTSRACRLYLAGYSASKLSNHKCLNKRGEGGYMTCILRLLKYLATNGSYSDKSYPRTYPPI